MVSAVEVKPLDGPEGYLRWKESVLLRLHTLDLAYVLSISHQLAVAALPKHHPTTDSVDDAASAAKKKKWERDDALCRGHIIATLSDRIFPDYVRHATANEVWYAVARTYELDMRGVARQQIAHAEALGSSRYKDDADFGHGSIYGGSFG